MKIDAQTLSPDSSQNSKVVFLWDKQRMYQPFLNELIVKLYFGASNLHIWRFSSFSPSSPAAQVAWVLCHSPTNQRKHDPVRSPRSEHGGPSAPADFTSPPVQPHTLPDPPEPQLIRLKSPESASAESAGGYMTHWSKVKHGASEVGKNLRVKLKKEQCARVAGQRRLDKNSL